ncbi:GLYCOSYLTRANSFERASE [Salix purpurea]|uniref:GLYCOSYLTRANSFERASE n=1 Tax=Salix purpurea TaxID=77065 RepID=A0A9Q0V3G1_SALPP|nr:GLYCOSYLTRANSFERASE [Salix purpurea]
MNSVFLVEEMKVGLAVKLADADDFASATELEERVTELMNSNKGEAVRERAKAFQGFDLLRRELLGFLMAADFEM